MLPHRPCEYQHAEESLADRLRLSRRVHGRIKSNLSAYLHHGALLLPGHLHLYFLPARYAFGKLEGKLGAVPILGPKPIPRLDPVCCRPSQLSTLYSLKAGGDHAIREWHGHDAMNPPTWQRNNDAPPSLRSAIRSGAPSSLTVHFLLPRVKESSSL